MIALVGEQPSVYSTLGATIGAANTANTMHLKAFYPPMKVSIAIDVTTGDKITPAPVEYDYPLPFEKGSMRLMAYLLETVLTEKLETVV